jgi:hypothetical protein
LKGVGEGKKGGMSFDFCFAAGKKKKPGAVQPHSCEKKKKPAPAL